MLSLLAAAWADSVELQAGAFADRGAARHSLVPAVGLRYRRDLDGLFLVSELIGTVRAVRGEVFEHTATTGRVAVGVGVEHVSGKVGIDVWGGPAAVVRVVGVEGYGAVGVDPGLRVASGATWHLSRKLGLRYQMGTTLRIQATPRFDFDGGVALAVRW